LDPDDLEALYARWPTEEKQNIERLAVSFKILDKDGSCRYFNLIIIATCLIGGALRRIDLGELQYMLAALGVPVNPKVVSFHNLWTAALIECACPVQTLWSMMEQIDTMPPYGSFGLEEWVQYNLLRRSKGDNSKLMSAEWAVSDLLAVVLCVAGVPSIALGGC